MLGPFTFATRKSAKIPLPPNSSRPRETTSLDLLDIHAWIQLLISIIYKQQQHATQTKIPFASHVAIYEPCLD
jgi:hypothetical protein